MMRVTVRVKPGSKKGSLIQPGLDGELLVYVREPALEGQANKAVVELLAKHYDTAKSNIAIIKGNKSRIKVIKIN